MNINSTDLMQHVISPTLHYLNMHSPAAVYLLLGTAAQQSGFDPFFRQGKGLGIYQISSEQHRSVWDNYLAFRPELASNVRGLASQHLFLKDPDQELATNLAYSTALAWIIYLQSENPLPAADDIDGLSQFWACHFCHQQSASQRPAKHFAQWIRDNGVAA